MEMSIELALPNGDSAGTGSAAAATAQATAPPPARMMQLAESLKMEHQLLRLPLEHLKKTVRANHRAVEREVSAVLSTVTELSLASSSNSSATSAEAVQRLTSLVSRLQGLKRKIDEGTSIENLQVQRSRARLDHLDALSVDKQAEWESTRLKRLLVDYMLRLSYYDSAAKFAEATNIQDLVDVEVFLEARRVIDALRNKDVGPALAWCSENKSRLKKSKSILEFQLRLQEFIELVRAESTMRAISYARKYLAPWGNTHMKELQRVLATLAFRSTTECAMYKVLFDLKQWDSLVEQFKQEFCRLYGMTLEPLLNIFLQAGLSALKTPFCFEDDCPKEDPLSQDAFRKLASQLPYSKQHNSKLVCFISKELMDSENPPLVLPNGYVYSSKALEEMAEKNSGKITCPRTGLVCNYNELAKVFVS